ncbi:hypothetical protein [Streptomyces collinus]|uniref:hypothetical protein n=1 Tax=Streptomyces collinus TaxID=42684 RepID=UPI00040B2DA6|nr:hypothetical protein [Streptomyces collinus]
MTAPPPPPDPPRRPRRSPHRAYLTHLLRGLTYGTGTAVTGLLAYWIQQRI